MRAPFQILVLPFRQGNRGVPEYAVLRRADSGWWQFIAGGGEGQEKPIEAAKREGFEEAGIPRESRYMPLDSRNTVPVEGVTWKFTWGEDVFVIPEYTFGVAGNCPLVPRQLSWIKPEKDWSGNAA